MISQAGFTAIDDLAHGFGGGYLARSCPQRAKKHAATASMAALRAAARDQHSIGHIEWRAGRARWEAHACLA